MVQQLVCPACGYAGEAKQKARGNGLVEFILWFFFIVPGLLYSLWSRGGKGKSVCPKCGNEKLIPMDTPMGKKLMAEYNPGMKIETVNPKGTSKAALYTMLIILGCVAIGLVMAFSKYKSDAEKAENELEAAQQTVQQNLQKVQDDSPRAKTR